MSDESYWLRYFPLYVKCVIEDDRLNPSDKIILTSLYINSCEINAEFIATVSLHELSMQTRISDRHMRKCIRFLDENSYIEKRMRMSREYGCESNSYVINLKKYFI